MDEVGVLCGADAIGQSIGRPTHAGVRVGRLYEVTNIDELLACDLMADARTDAVLGRVIAHSRALLKHLLHLSQRLYFLGEPTVLGHAGGVQEMVFENRKFRWIWEIVVITILQLQEFVNLSCCELV